MSASDHTTALNASEPPLLTRAPLTATRPSPRSWVARVHPHHVALAGVLALSAVLNTHRLAQNGYANTFYSAGVKSMLLSWHNFLFVSFDPGGLVTIDKPPLGVWLQAASAELFGLSPMSLLLPEAIVSTIAIAVLYRVLARRLGPAAGLAGALALAVFPSFVAVSRDNGVDPLLILLMILACGATLNAIEDGRWRWLVCTALLVGMAFNTKTLAAYLIVPGIAFAYLVCAPGSWLRRTTMLVAAGLLMGLASFSWIAFVEATPTSKRPFIGSSTDNSELGLTFNYNGLGRVEGEVGGPGQVRRAEGAVVRSVPRHRASTSHGKPQKPASVRVRVRRAPPPLVLPNGRLRNPITFGGAAGPLRLFEARLADQGAWILPFALIGLLAFALLPLIDTRVHTPSDAARSEGLDLKDTPLSTPAGGQAGERSRQRDPRLAVLIVFGGWLLAEIAILDFSNGIVHPYYISALAPAAASMFAAGAFALAHFARCRDWRALLLLPCAVGATIAAQLAILSHQHYMQWFAPVLIAGAAIAMCAMAVRRLAGPAMAVLVMLLLIAPAAYASTTWLARVQGTFPAAGPHQASGSGKFGVNGKSMRVYRNMIRYVSTHKPGTRWAVLTDAAPTAAPLILLGLPAGAMAGYSGIDPALDGPGLAHLIALGEARYVVLGGAYASRGGNLATKAALHVCPQVPFAAWHGPPPAPYELVLFDCAGRERALSKFVA
jgi:4-amino-4-deoxy-L-arabinose transferase-like glycosyltransferase